MDHRVLYMDHSKLGAYPLCGLLHLGKGPALVQNSQPVGFPTFLEIYQQFFWLDSLQPTKPVRFGAGFAEPQHLLSGPGAIPPCGAYRFQ